MSNDNINRIVRVLPIYGFKTELEYRFHPIRKFRFDIVVTHYGAEELIKKGIKIAIEYEGGIFTGGRHTRPGGYAKDTEKYNLATMCGWRVLRYTVKQLLKRNYEFAIADDVMTLMKQILSERK